MTNLNKRPIEFIDIRIEMNTQLWEPFSLKPKETLFFHIGPLQLWMKRTEDELCLYHEEAHTAPCIIADDNGLPPPPDAKWRRWASEPHQTCHQLKPVMQDRPVIVRPDNELSFLPDAGGLFYARIPIWIAVMTGIQTPDITVCEIPTKTLPNSWFGPNTTRGELCYGMQTSAKRSLEGVDTTLYRAICPVKIHNDAEQALNLQRLCIRTEHLNIYIYENQLWTSRLDIVFRGENKHESIALNDKWFTGERAPKLISKRRTPPQENLFKRSLSTLKVFQRI